MANPIDKNPVKEKETIDYTHNQDKDLEKIRYYQGTWQNFFDYWKKRGVEQDPYKGTILKYPQEQPQQEEELPIQDFGTYDKAKQNAKLHESFEEFVNESASAYAEMILAKDQDFDQVKKLLRTDKKANHLNFTHWSHGQPLGSIRGHLITMFFDNPKSEVTDFIQRNGIKVANKSYFDL